MPCDEWLVSSGDPRHLGYDQLTALRQSEGSITHRRKPHRIDVSGLSVEAEPPDFFACAHLPHASGAIASAGNEPLTVRGEREAHHPIAVAFEELQLFPGVGVP